MATLNHTRGPWKVGHDGIYVETPSGNLTIVSGIHSDDLSHSEANAKLIAAAPEMLAALKAFHPSVCKAPGDLARAWENANEIITRATA